MPQVKAALDDAMMRRLVPGKVRVTISVYDTKAIPRSYRIVPGHSEILEVQNVRAFRRLWRAIKRAISKKGGWRDVDRALSGAAGDSDPDDSALDVHTRLGRAGVRINGEMGVELEELGTHINDLDARLLALEQRLEMTAQPSPLTPPYGRHIASDRRRPL
jgi:hypothetical protein